jgi:two-component system, cell cycle sensor histidine kinase and response regulator CckA
VTEHVLEQIERQLEVASLNGEVQAVMRGIVEHLMRLDGADGASLSTVENGMAYFRVSLGADSPLGGQTIPLEQTLGSVAAATGEIQVLRADDGTIDESLTAGAKVILLVPVDYDGATRGILGVRSARRDAFTEDDILTTTMLARSAAIALRNAELVERVERSEREYRRLHDQAADAILVTDDEGGILDANDEAGAMFGYGVGELREMIVYDLFTDAERSLRGFRTDELMHAGFLRGERRFRRRDGSELLVEYSTRLLDDGRRHTTLRDVTQRAADEARLRTSLERTRAIVDTQREISALELDHDAVTNAIVERAQRLTRADGALVAMAEGDELVWRFASGIAAEYVGLRRPSDRSLGGIAFVTGETVWVSDAENDPRANKAIAELVGMRSLISAPLEREGRLVGVLTVLSRDIGAFDTLAVETTTVMAQFVAGVIRNAEELETRRKLVERLRLQGEVVEHMQTALWVWRLEAEGTIRLDYANAASAAATGLEPTDVLGRTLDEVVPAAPDEVRRVIAAVLESDKPIDLGEVEYGDERIRPGVFHLKAFPLPDSRIAIAFENVTERVHAHRALEESEARFRGAFYSSSIGTALSDADGQIVQVNDRLCELLGYAPHELLQIPWRTLVELEDVEGLTERTADLRSGARDYYIHEVRLRRKDGALVWTRVAISLVRDYAGEPAHYVVLVEDVSARYALELQLRQSQKMEAVGRLAGGIAHDFNNLLTAIRGYTEFLVSSLEDERLRRHAVEIERAAARAASLTGQLLAFSRRQVLQPRVVGLNAIVSDMEMMLRRLIGEDVELVVRLERELGLVRADPTQVEQVIINLAVNARDAMPGGGSLTIETRNVPAERPAVELRLTDTGIGMTEDQRQRLFDPFFTTKEGGTGLGLATVYGIVEQSGGTIEVDSAPGLGTSFRIELPRVEEAASAPETPFVDAAPKNGTETILLVEDEPVVRRLVAEILETTGYTVLQAADGPSALELLQRHKAPVDLLLTDLVMPGMSGREVAQVVTQMHPGTHVVYMSGYTGSVIDHHGLVAEGVTFVQKPFSADDLSRALRSLLDA